MTGEGPMESTLRPAELILRYQDLFKEKPLPGPVLDLACGQGHNGIFLAKQNLPVICCDLSPEALQQAQRLATLNHTQISCWQIDLEKPGRNPLPSDHYGAILVFRYLHRPLIPCIKKALRPKGLLFYETYTIEQPRFGRPHNPRFLLKPRELYGWFSDWIIIHYFEGIKDHPPRAVAQIVCRKP